MGKDYILFKINKDDLDINELSKYRILEYVDRSRIDGMYIFKLHRTLNMMRRVKIEYLMNKTRWYTPEQVLSELRLIKDVKLELVSNLSDHIPNLK